MKKKQFTAGDLFRVITKEMENQGILPKILDYSLARTETATLTTTDFSIQTYLDFGGNEGIYLCVYLVEGKERQCIGTYKTLYTDKDSMYEMSKLSADFVLTMKSFIESNSELFAA